MSGEFDPIYVDARRALLDMLDALADQKEATVLVGAQAIYLRVGEGGLAVAPYTSDADFALDPRLLLDSPLLEQALREHGFLPSSQQGMVGTWVTASEGGRLIPVDLLVPETLDLEGRRAAKLGAHGDRTARRARGLEAAVVDRDRLTIKALDPEDSRAIETWVAGPAALVVAKLHKIAERTEQPHRLKDKDALDIYRLLLDIEVVDFRTRFERLLADPISHERTQEAIAFLRELFAAPTAHGCVMTARALTGLADEQQTAMSCAFLAQDVLSALEGL